MSSDSEESNEILPLEIDAKELIGISCSNFPMHGVDEYCLLYTVKYCPVICGEISTLVLVTGQVGVWRTTQLNFITSDDLAIEEMVAEDAPFQPEAHDFMVVEVRKGMTLMYGFRFCSYSYAQYRLGSTIYMKSIFNDECSKYPKDELTFDIKGINCG